ncbi:hypothetical protein BH10PLA2_BH10PLA2_23310 [soil metagenome]
MNARERLLAFVVLGFLGVAVGGFLFHTFFWSPLQKAEDSIIGLREQIEKKNARVAEIQAQEPTLARWKALTLPSDVKLASLEYDKWLSNEVQKSGITKPSVTPKPTDLKSGQIATGTAAAKTPPVYAKLGFSVTGRATLGNLVRFLEKSYSAGLLHQIRILSIQRPLTQMAEQKKDELDITLSIEALSLAGADQRKSLLPVIDPRLLAIATIGGLRRAPIGLALAPDALGPRGDLGPGKLASSDREYADLAKKDIFVGRTAVPETRASVDANRYYTLTDISEDELKTSSGAKKIRQANMFDRYNNRKVPLQVEKSSHVSEFAVREENYSIIFRGSVVKINDRDVIFQRLDNEGKPVKDNFYRIVLGGNMQDALRKTLSKDEVAREGLLQATTIKKDVEEGDDG